MTGRRSLIALCVLVLHLCGPLMAQDRLRVAMFDAELRRDGPGLLLRDIEGGKDPQVEAVIDVIAVSRPDVLALMGFDWDYDGRALAVLAERLKAKGMDYPYVFTARPNAGLATGVDLDGDGLVTGPGDAQGYGDFSGKNGLAVLSVHPILEDEIQDFTSMLWRDLPGALMPMVDGRPFPSELAQAVQRLSSTNHWVLPILLPHGIRMKLLMFRATPPVFDGPEDLNGRRNHDEVVFWQYFLDGAFGHAPTDRFVLAAGANLDPFDGEGRTDAILSLLRDPRLIDPEPSSPGAAETEDDGQLGAPALDTVDWGVGSMRVDYLLPSADWNVLGSGVVWPAEGSPLRTTVEAASRHRLVWVDLALP